VPVPFSVPDSARLPTVSLKAARSRIAPEATLSAALSARRSLPPSRSVPPLTLTVAAPEVPFSAEVPPAWVSVPEPGCR
jgi:hypothetical protein